MSEITLNDMMNCRTQCMLYIQSFEFAFLSTGKQYAIKFAIEHLNLALEKYDAGEIGVAEARWCDAVGWLTGNPPYN